MLEAAQEAGVKRIVYTSSVATLGLNSNGTPADEATPSSLATMVGTYKKSKYLAEQKVHKLIAAKQLPCVIVNPSTPIGPYDIKPTPTGRMIVEAARGMMPAFVDTGLNVVHVDDVAMGHLQAFRQGHFGERYILGGENLSLSAILALVAQVTNRSPPRIKLPVSGLMPLAYAAEAVARITGKEPFVTRDGLLMAKKKMYFRSTKAEAALAGYNHRPAADAIPPTPCVGLRKRGIADVLADHHTHCLFRLGLATMGTGQFLAHHFAAAALGQTSYLAERRYHRASAQRSGDAA